MKRSKGKERWIHCYKSSQKILLVGEGDFSFSACLARAFRSAENMVATTYLDRNSLVCYHWTGIPHLEGLESLGCLLLYKVDVYKMHTHPKLKNIKFDIIIFNFPHAGHFDYLCERDPELIEMHMNLVEAYFKSARKMLTDGGEVHLRHREDPPYDSWNVVLLAGKAGLTLKEKVYFNKSDYPGYHNKRGGCIKTNKTFPIRCAYTYKFVLYIPKVIDQHCYDLSNQVHDDKIQVPCGKDIFYDLVNVSMLKEEDHVKSLCQKVEVDDLLETDETNDDLPNSNFAVNDLDLHVLDQMVGDEHLKKFVQVHVDLELQKVGDDYQMNVDVQKFDKTHSENHDSNHDFPKNGELYVLEMIQDLHQQHNETDRVHVDSKPELGGSARLKTEGVTRSNIICNFCLPAEWLLTWFES